MSDIGYQIRKGFDKVSFEADKLMRANRVRAEAARLKRQAEKETRQLGEKVLDLAASGAKLDPELQSLVQAITTLNSRIEEKYREIEAINGEVWVNPVQPSLPEPSTTTVEKGVSKGVEVSQIESVATCPSCQGPLRTVSVYCPNCGLKLQP